MGLPRRVPAAGMAALAWIALAAGSARGAEVEPPQGYVAFSHAFPGDPEEGGKAGYTNYDFGLVLDALPSRATGTFWASTFEFRNSSDGLPANHVGGDQGSYMGVQHAPDGSGMAILSIWWALEAEPGEGASCLSDDESWYTDDRPFEPEIDTIAESDPKREVDGGPFISCRLPITLEAGAHYRLRIAEDSAGWWSGWLINDDSQSELLIGRVRVPETWGRLTQAAGFIEQFGPMPDGCATIPSSETTVAAATGNDGAAQAELSANIYGTCEASIRPRYRETRGEDGSLHVAVQ